MAKKKPEFPSTTKLAELGQVRCVCIAVRCLRRVFPKVLQQLVSGRDSKSQSKVGSDLTPALSGLSLIENWLKRKYPARAEFDTLQGKIIRTQSESISIYGEFLHYLHVALSMIDLPDISPTLWQLRNESSKVLSLIEFCEGVSGAVRDSNVFREKVEDDIRILLRYSLADKKSLDASENGECGPLWGSQAPSWYLRGLGQMVTLGLLEPPNNSDDDERQPDTLVELIKTQGELQELNQMLLLEQASKKKSEEELAIAHSGLKDLRLRSDDLSRTVKEFQHLEKGYTNRLEELEKETEQSRRECEQVQTELAKANSERNNLAREVEKLQRQLDDRRRELEEQKPQGIGWYFENYATPLALRQLATVLFLFTTLLLTLFAIAEVHQRQVLNKWLRTQSEQLRDQFANSRDLALPDFDTRRQELDTARRGIELLSFAGADRSDRTLAGIASSLTQPSAASGNGFVPVPPSGSWTEYLFIIRYCNSDLLLSLIVMASGIIGATIAVMRSKSRSISLLDIGVGMSVGYATFLAVRGGKSVFLLDADPLLLINPYNSAFFGLLAGLFTDLAFDLLRDLAQQVVDKLRVAFVTPGKESTNVPGGVSNSVVNISNWPISTPNNSPIATPNWPISTPSGIPIAGSTDQPVK